jgi:phosphoglycerate dehydrogenase-like enzyme
MKAVLQFRASPGFREQLAAAQSDLLKIVVVDEADKAKFALEMQDADVLLHVLEPVTAEVIDNAPRLRLIQKIGVGVNTIDLAAARAHGIAVANMPGSNSRAVAEMTLALMLAALRRIAPLSRDTARGAGWSLPIDTFDRVGEIHGRTVGLVGYGEVPRHLAPVLYALGAKLIYTARSPKAHALAKWCAFSDLLAQSDVVSLHIPLTEDTTKLINAESIRQMKPGVVIVNTARGGLIDEAALLAALATGHVAAAGLDTLAIEPIGASHPLCGLDNVVVTPHIAWLTPETLARSIGIAVENCRRLMSGEPLLHQVVP